MKKTIAYVLLLVASSASYAQNEKEIASLQSAKYAMQEVRASICDPATDVEDRLHELVVFDIDIAPFLPVEEQRQWDKEKKLTMAVTRLCQAELHERTVIQGANNGSHKSN